jgi:hypothetical protein
MAERIERRPQPIGHAFRDRVVEVRWTREERLSLGVAARQHGLSIASYVRMRVLPFLLHDARAADHPDAGRGRP